MYQLDHAVKAKAKESDNPVDLADIVHPVPNPESTVKLRTDYEQPIEEVSSLAKAPTP